jgi:hypothetical protein
VAGAYGARMACLMDQVGGCRKTCSTGVFWKDGSLVPPGRLRLVGASEQALLCPPGRFAFPKPRVRQDPAGLRQTLTDDLGAGYGAMHRAEGGHGRYALCRQIIANRGVILADRELYLVQTAAWTTRPRPWVRVSRDRRQVQLGKHGDAWLAHESKCPNLQRLANLSRAPVAGCLLRAWLVRCGGGHGN